MEETGTCRFVVFAVMGRDQSATEVEVAAAFAVVGLGSIPVAELRTRRFAVDAVTGQGRSVDFRPAEGLVAVLRTRRFSVDAVAGQG